MKLRKERDFHRMHHKRVVQEKDKLITEIKRYVELDRRVISFVCITTFRRHMQHHLEKEIYWDIGELDFSKFSFL